MTEDETGLLYRIDERTRSLQITVQEIRNSMATSYVKREEFMPVQRDFVSQHEFSPVRRIVYGLVGLMLTGICAGLLALVLK